MTGTNKDPTNLNTPKTRNAHFTKTPLLTKSYDEASQELVQNKYNYFQNVVVKDSIHLKSQQKKSLNFL
jgi:hypothetical protein